MRNDEGSKPRRQAPGGLNAEAAAPADGAPEPRRQPPSSAPSMFRPPPSTLRPLFTHWLPLIVYGLFITLQSHYPTPEVVPRWQGLDKLLHVGAYALLGLLFCRAYHSRWPAAAERSLARAGAASAAIFGLFDEIHQHFTPFRSADPLDVLADALGGALGVLAFHFLLELVRPRPPASA